MYKIKIQQRSAVSHKSYYYMKTHDKWKILVTSSLADYRPYTSKLVYYHFEYLLVVLIIIVNRNDMFRENKMCCHLNFEIVFMCLYRDGWKVIHFLFLLEFWLLGLCPCCVYHRLCRYRRSWHIAFLSLTLSSDIIWGRLDEVRS